MNDLPAIGYPRYAQSTLGSPGGNIASRFKEMYGGKLFSRTKKRDFGDRSTLFRPIFIANGLGECWQAEDVNFCFNNREICDKIYRLISLLA